MLVLALALSLAAFSPLAQSNDPVQDADGIVTTDSSPREVSAPQGAIQPRAAGQSMLQMRAPAPRTMRAHWPIFVVFAGSWGAIMLYLMMLGRRARGIGGRVRLLDREE